MISHSVGSIVTWTGQTSPPNYNSWARCYYDYFVKGSKIQAASIFSYHSHSVVMVRIYRISRCRSYSKLLMYCCRVSSFRTLFPQISFLWNLNYKRRKITANGDVLCISPTMDIYYVIIYDTRQYYGIEDFSLLCYFRQESIEYF